MNNYADNDEKVTESLAEFYKFHVWNLSRKQQLNRKILVRVLAFSVQNKQFVFFESAASSCARKYGSNNIEYDYLTTEWVRKEFESPENLIDHVLEADVHFILGHAHQRIFEYNQ